MTRSLNLSYPLGILDVQRTLAVCAEDGVAAVIIAMNNATLQREALESVNVDVLGSERVAQGEDVASLKTRYAFVSDRALALTVPTGESDELAAESPAMFDQDSSAICLLLLPWCSRQACAGTTCVVLCEWPIISDDVRRMQYNTAIYDTLKEFKTPCPDERGGNRQALTVVGSRRRSRH